MHNTYKSITICFFIFCLFDFSSAIADECTTELYIGYRAESPVNNPEDPGFGAIHLNIPKEDGQFEGELFFSNLSCDGNSVGIVVGNKIGSSLSGRWSGRVDNTSQTGTFTGQQDQQGNYSGRWRETIFPSSR